MAKNALAWLPSVPSSDKLTQAVAAMRVRLGKLRLGSDSLGSVDL